MKYKVCKIKDVVRALNIKKIIILNKNLDKDIIGHYYTFKGTRIIILNSILSRTDRITIIINILRKREDEWNKILNPSG